MRAVKKSTVTADVWDHAVGRRVATVNSASGVVGAPAKLSKLVGVGDALCHCIKGQIFKT